MTTIPHSLFSLRPGTRRTISAALTLVSLLFLCSCQWKPSILGRAGGDGLDGTWSGVTTSGHRLTIQVDERGQAIRLRGAPTWKLRQSFAEKLLRREYGDSEADAVASMLAERPNESSGGSETLSARRSVQSWDAGKQRLDYRAAGSSLYQGREFRSRWDYPRTASYQFFFKQKGWGAAILNGVELLQLRRR